MANNNKKINARFASEFLAKTEEKVNLQFQPTFLLPGENPIIDQQSSQNKIILGWGLQNISSNGSNSANPNIVATSAGTLQYRPTVDGSFYKVHHPERRKYFPSHSTNMSKSVNALPNEKYGDQVVGIIEERGGDYYMVNIFSGTHCVLNRLSFEGATKRNKPELRRGDLVYARVISTLEGGDIEISCLHPGSIKKDWTTGETVQAPLTSRTRCD